MKLYITRAIALAAVATAGFALSAPTGAAAVSKVPKVKFEDYRLPNGLRVVVSQDTMAPVVALCVTYNVGSRNETVGHTGFAHLFEHMMFQGSQNVGRGEHFILISDNGGTFNGTTSADRTIYYEELPSNQLDLELFLESDRMRALDVTQENLDNQRQVVIEERRQRLDNQPYGQAYEALLDMTFKNFAYKHSTIGSIEDLNAATIDQVKSFFKTYYAPNNATLSVVGNFDVKEVKAKIAKYFGDIPSQAPAPPVDTTEPPSTEEVRRTLTDGLARTPRIQVAYRIPSAEHPDHAALSTLGLILGYGHSSRLYQTIVEPQTALSVSAVAVESRGPSVFQVTSGLAAGGDVDAVEQKIEAEIARVQESGVTDAEIQRIHTLYKTFAVSRLETPLGKATLLSGYATVYNDPDRINKLLPQELAVTAADVQRVAKKYFTKENRIVLIVQPKPGTVPSKATGDASAQNSQTSAEAAQQ